MASYDYLIVGGGMTADAAARGIRERDPKPARIGHHRRRAAPAVQPAAADQGPVEGRRAGQHLAQGRRGGGGAPPRARGPARWTRRASGSTDDQRRHLRVRPAPARDRRRAAPAPGGADGVIYFRTLDDYRAARAARRSGRRFVVIGGGFIGAEIAAALRHAGSRGHHDRVPSQGLGARCLPGRPLPLSGGVLPGAGRHRARRASRPSGSRDAGGRFVVHTQRGGRGPGRRRDRRVSGIEPDVELARKAGLAVEDGIVVDEQLRDQPAPRSTRPATWRSFPNPALGKRIARRARGQRQHDGARSRARTWPGPACRYDHLPFFYSDLFDLGYEAVGDVDARLETVVDWKEQFSEGVVYYLRGRPGARRAPLEHLGPGRRGAGADRGAGAVPARAAEGSAPGEVGVAAARLGEPQ